MSSLTFASRQSFHSLLAFRLPWTRPLLAATFLPNFFAWQKPFNWAVPTLQSLLDLLPPFLLAVPKKKVSHSRKAMRSANKGLKDKMNIVQCPACGSPKLAHHLCQACYFSLRSTWRKEDKKALKMQSAAKQPVRHSSGGSISGSSQEAS